MCRTETILSTDEDDNTITYYMYDRKKSDQQTPSRLINKLKSEIQVYEKYCSSRGVLDRTLCHKICQ